MRLLNGNVSLASRRITFKSTVEPKTSSMEVLSGPWADLALLLRQAVTLINKETDTVLPLWLLGLLLFLSVCLLLLQMIVFLSWKLRHVEADMSGFQWDMSTIYRQRCGAAHRRTRSFGSHSST